MAFCCTAALAWSEACEAWRASAFRPSTSDSRAISRLAKDSAADVYSPTLAASPPFCGLVGHDHGLAGVGVDLLELLHRAVEAHLGLLLVGDDVGRLLGEAAVLVLRLDDRLLELDLRVGLLVERRR